MSKKYNNEVDKLPANSPGSGYATIAPWFDIAATERAVLDFWSRTDAFGKLVKKNEDGEHYSFLDGPITANNPMGVHHAWGRALKDAYQRYWAMNGRKLRYQNGFDCQGLWVEVEVEKEKGFATRQDIEEYGLERFVNECKARANKYATIQTEQSVRLGMWMDWENSYYTMSDQNNYMIWSFLKKCHQRGKLYRGTDVMPWSGRAGTAYSQMEVIEGRKLVAHKAIFLRFPLRERENENLLVWTTTPWTLTSNVAAAVNVELEYVKLREHRTGQAYYLAKENLEHKRLESQFQSKKDWIDGVPKLKTLSQIFKERGGYSIEETVRGADLVGLAYDGPFDDLEAQGIAGGYPYTDPKLNVSAREAHRVIDGGKDNRGNPIVQAGEGTGIVHIAPGCGDVDHVIGNELGLPKLAPLDESARFLPPFGAFAGREALAADTVDEILAELGEKDILVATELYPHVYPHCWRSGVPLVFRLVDEWYIHMDWRDEIIDVAKQINWLPDWGLDREVEWLTNMRDWMISKKRFWGLALPIWVCEKCESFEVIGSKRELEERAVEGWPEFDGHSPHRPWVDNVRIACSACGGRATRVEDVGNPWLDAGIVPYSTLYYGEDGEYWKDWIPADLVLECFPGQFRNWFYALLAMSTMMEGIPPFRNLVGYALVRDEHGEEMHKSTGNAIWFDEAAEKVGADVMRWLYVSRETTNNLNFGYGILREIRGRFINTLWNAYSFFVNYARLFDYRRSGAPGSIDDWPDFDRWVVTELQDMVHTCRTSIEGHNMRGAALAIEAFVEDLSGWYIRHNRRRFWSEDAADRGRALDTLFLCLDTVTRALAPMLPFLSEAIYQNLVRGIDVYAPESIHHTEYPTVDPSLRDNSIASEMRALKRLRGIALSARESRKIRVRQPLGSMDICPATETEKRAAERFEETLLSDLNVKSLAVLELGRPSPLSYLATPNFKTLGPRFGKDLKAVIQVIELDSERVARALASGEKDVSISVGGRSLTLSSEDVTLNAVAPDGFAVAEDRGTWIRLDVQLTPELKCEGLMRDILRRLQVARKDAGLAIEDRIHLRWSSDSESIQGVFETWGEHLARELLCDSISEAAPSDSTSTVSIDDARLSYLIDKA